MLYILTRVNDLPGRGDFVEVVAVVVATAVVMMGVVVVMGVMVVVLQVMGGTVAGS